MDHMQYLMVRSHNPTGQPTHHPMEPADDAAHEHMSGHALMATSAPLSHILLRPADKYPHQMPPALAPAALARLLHLSARLPVDRAGEITPVMAWSVVLAHPRVALLDSRDVDALKACLSSKVRCYGYVFPCPPPCVCVCELAPPSLWTDSCRVLGQVWRRRRGIRGS
jgi:hypothetical protein